MGNEGPFIPRAQKPIVARFCVKCVLCAAPSPSRSDRAAPAIMMQSVPSLLLRFVEVRGPPPSLLSPVGSMNDTKDDFAVVLCKILHNSQCDYFHPSCIIFFFFFPCGHAWSDERVWELYAHSMSFTCKHIWVFHWVPLDGAEWCTSRAAWRKNKLNHFLCLVCCMR